jgi:hypothetical protein
MQHVARSQQMKLSRCDTTRLLATLSFGMTAKLLLLLLLLLCRRLALGGE